MSLFIMESGAGFNRLDVRDPKTKVRSTWTYIDLNRAVVAHAKRHGSDRTKSILQEVTGATYTGTFSIAREHRGELIARMCRGMIGRPHMHTAHKDGP